MGQGLPKAVTSVVVKRCTGFAFRVGFAEMNGWRPSMEDAHVIHCQDTWGFFGVFDGHGGDQCSQFIARRLTEELQNGPPEDDASMTALALKLDKEFLELGQPSGSTGTFVIVKPPQQEGGNYLLRVGNIGDSRVLLGRADGTLVEGHGTDGGLTTDHKPDHPSERARIERTGGNVQEVMGVARVNGDLAVSRAFGDSQHKMSGGPAQEDHPVSAAPELTSLECGPTDFLMLVCDGISEGTFPNRDVVRLAAEHMKLTSGGSPDPGLAAAAVCREALRCGSKDNLSCMIVLLGGGEIVGAEKELLPGPFEAPDHAGFRKAYTAMAEHAGLSLEQAIEMRYDTAKEELKKLQQAGAGEAEAPDDQDPSEKAKEASGNENAASPSQQVAALVAELSVYGAGPPQAPGTQERTEWFRNWMSSHVRSEVLDDDGDGPEGGGVAMTRDQLIEMLERNPRLLAMAEQQGYSGLFNSNYNDGAGARRAVRVAPFNELRPAVEGHPALKWDDRLAEVCGHEGVVLRDDESDGTSQVRFPPPLGFKAWLPTNMLIDIGEKRVVRIAPVDELRQAVEAHPALKWDERLESVGGEEGIVVRDDESDGTSQVRFPAPLSFTAWFPSATLTEVSTTKDPAAPGEGPGTDTKRQRTE